MQASTGLGSDLKDAEMFDQGSGGILRLAILWLVWMLCAPIVFASDALLVDVCQVMRQPAKFAGRWIRLNGIVKPTMHGTFLAQAGCDDAMMITLPEEIANYRGGIKVVKDGQFERFLNARYDHSPDAAGFIAEFTGQLEFAARGKGFGYYKNRRTRLILQSVRQVESPAQKQTRRC